MEKLGILFRTPVISQQLKLLEELEKPPLQDFHQYDKYL